MPSICRGYSDDTVSVTRGAHDTFDIPCWDHNVHITFDDGTEILFRYHMGAWEITEEYGGTAIRMMTEAFDRCGDKTTDVFLINADIVHYELLPRKEDAHVGEV